MQQEERPAAPQRESPQSTPSSPAPTPGPGSSGTRNAKPGTVQTIAILTLISGILNCVLGASLIFLTVFVWTVPAAFSIVVGILEIVYASRLLADPVRVFKPAKHIAIMEIINIVNGSATSLAAGIVALVLYNNPEIQEFFRQQERRAGG